MIHADMLHFSAKGRNTRMPNTTTRQDKTTRQDTQILEVSEDRAEVCVGMVGCDFTLSCFSRPRPSFDLPHFAFAKRARVRVRVRVRVRLG